MPKVLNTPDAILNQFNLSEILEKLHEKLPNQIEEQKLVRDIIDFQYQDS